MSETPDVANSEKSATSAVGGRGGETRASAPSQGASSSAPPRKVRSCFVCRQRKVRCDKTSPCANCRRAGIPCVLPSAERPPRWARRQELLANNAVAASQTVEPGDIHLMERLRYLESLVKDLNEQLQQARSGYGSSSGPSPGSHTYHQDDQYGSQNSLEEAGGIKKQFGRMVVQDSGQARYVSSGFWSRIDDELDGLQDESDESVRDGSPSSDGETPADANDGESNTQQSAFPFPLPIISSNLELHKLCPLPSQLPFLVEVFSENVYPFLSIVHLPSIKQTIHGVRRGGLATLSPSTEALMFSIYHAAIVSMEEDEVFTNFGESKADLTLRYRRGLEIALAKADALNSPNTTLLQAFAIFLALARRYESPRYIWMMTGLLVRMAHSIGLQRDGSQFKHLSSYEVEMRRRVWWAVVLLDVRSSEDQGTDTIIREGTFDTRLPLNINDDDIDPRTREAPSERRGATNTSSLRATARVAHIAIKIASLTGKDSSANEERGKLLDRIHESFDQEYLQYVPESERSKYERMVAISRINQGKLTLLAYLPVLFSSPGEHVSQELRTTLLIAAIQVAEYNHALHTDEGSVHLRWIWETHTHWYAIVFLLIETARRPWSPIVERAWMALQSDWLFPRPSSVRSHLRIWIPVRKLMQRARMHRESELRRLRQDPSAVAALLWEDQRLPLSSSSGLSPKDTGIDEFRERWQSLVTQQNDVNTSSSCHSMSSDTAHPYPSGTMLDSSRDRQLRPCADDRAKRTVSLDQTRENGPCENIQTSSLDNQTPVDLGSQFDTLRNDSTAERSTYDQGLGAWPEFANWLSWAEIDPSLDDFLGADMDLDLTDPNLNFNSSVNCD